MNKQTRWQCPAGKHPGQLAPNRPRRDDVRRYCLECSKATGRLTQRIAPTLQAKRQERSVKVKEQRERKAAAAYESKYIVNGVDVMKLLKACATLPVYGGRRGRPYRRIKNGETQLKIVRCKRMQRHYVGYWNGDITLYAWPSISEAAIREIILHELMHCAARTWNHPCRIGHCRHFVAKLKVAWRQAGRKLGELQSARTPGSNKHYLVNVNTPAEAQAA